MDANETKKHVDDIFDSMTHNLSMNSIFGDVINKNSENKAILTNEDKIAAQKAIHVMMGHSKFIASAVENDKITKHDMETYLDMIRIHFDDMTNLFNMEQHISDKLDESYELLRKANTEIRQLKAEIGKSVSASNVTAGIEYYSALFKTWYELAGFRYAKTEYLPYGILADFSFEVENKVDATSNENLNEELKQKIANSVQYEFEFDKYDLRDEGYHREVLDTDKNRNNIMTLFDTAFPGVKIRKFESWADKELYLLTFEVVVSFAQLEEWIKRI